WEELEVEVVRDSKNQMAAVCYIENVDPLGIHTGDSFCVAPMLTISLGLQERLKNYAFKIVENIEVIGGTNVQFAHDPVSDRVVVIEINPRTSRSSALASKATGFPIAAISTILATGMTLDEIPYWRDGTLDKYTPSDDYVVVKFPRWAFEKFKGSYDKLGTQMRSVGEVMSIGKNYKEALQKAIRSLEIGRYGLGFARNYNQKPLNELMELLHETTSERQFVIYEALRKGAGVEDICRLTNIKPWFIEQMKELVMLEEEILKYKGYKVIDGSNKGIGNNIGSSNNSRNNSTGSLNIPDNLLIQAKKDGFSDRYLANLLGVSEGEIRNRRIALGLSGAWEAIPVSGVVDAAYYYSTYNTSINGIDNNTDNSIDKNPVTNNQKVMVLGGGPNRIGQGIEFDYCCVHAAFAIRDMGLETIIVNCNPETVSTDYDTSDKLYFEPLTTEDVLNIYHKENPLGVIVQFGGQTPLNIAAELAREGVCILGTQPDVIDLAEDRDLFRHIMEKLDIPMPASGMASNLEQALEIANQIGYPLMVRPSYVLGGRGMEIVYDEEMLKQYVAAAVDITPERPILIDKFLENAIESEADAISDGVNAYVPAVMEHIELAGIHSGDSACVIPSITIPKKHLDTISEYTRMIGEKLNVIGLINVQYAIADDKVYVLEANPRASRTVPLVSKVCNVQMAKLATEIMVQGRVHCKPVSLDIAPRIIPHYGVKEAVFPFNMFPEVDPVLGPEMRSTGEVLGLSKSFGIAFFKSQEATQNILPTSGTVLISVAEQDRPDVLEVAQRFNKLGFKIKATRGTQAFLAENGIEAEIINKLFEGRPNIIDGIMNREIQLVINTPLGKRSQADDSYIRKAAIKHRVTYITTLAAALASAKGIAAYRENSLDRDTVKSLQSYHNDIKEV
ncbi:MAG TPA: carbamoyl-phosphate synthase large subunit, partial [Clostridiales bacterium]|nr:carbamoyl-phosphate synthase large subunit [Clostridiales bacterium]